jgi:hypothetical protein
MNLQTALLTDGVAPETWVLILNIFPTTHGKLAVPALGTYLKTKSLYLITAQLGFNQINQRKHKN